MTPIAPTIIPAHSARDPAHVGGKAAALAQLKASGFRVPDFVVIGAAVFPASQRTHAQIQQQILTALDDLGPGPFAVRSSAVAEDGAEHSHAGQFLSVLNVAREDVVDTAFKVWQSGFSQSVADYQETRNIATDDTGPSVIVQTMVPARAAGVAFTADPVKGTRNRFVISAVRGLADALVGGRIEGDDIVLDRADGQVVKAGKHRILSTDDLHRLWTLLVNIEAHFGTPQDVEWACDDDHFHVLQSRPITTGLRPAPIADDTITIFDNSNIIESYPGIVSPLTFSFAQYAYARVYRRFMSLVGVRGPVIADNAALFENMLACINGRVYYNLINWYRLIAMLPGYRLNRGFMETMMGVGEPLPTALADALSPPPATGFGRLYEYARLVRAGSHIVWQALVFRRTRGKYFARLEKALQTPASALATMPLRDLAREYRRMEAQLLDKWDAPLINDFLCMMVFGGSRRVFEKWGQSAGLALHNDYLIGQGDIVSAEPARRIVEMADQVRGDDAAVEALIAGDNRVLQSRPDLAENIEAYLAKFADRCAEELKLESIPLDEEPTPLLMSIGAAARSAAAAVEREQDFPARFDTVFANARLRRWIAMRLANWARARVRDRENLRFERTRIFGRARRLFLAAGAQLHALDAIDDPRDIFMLTIDEVLGFIEGFAVTTDLRGLVRVRRDAVDRAQETAPLGERLKVTGVWSVNSVTHVSQVSQVETQGEGAASPDQRQGTACSKGVTRAHARIIQDPRCETLQHGDILVARHTDPGWIAVFTNASAIVAERGSLLSHSAIVARELGIPCVVGLRGAMTWIKNGETIEVDGATGMVRKIAAASAPDTRGKIDDRQ